MAVSAMTLSTVPDENVYTDRSFTSLPGGANEGADSAIPKLTLADGAVSDVRNRVPDDVLEDDEMIPPPNGRLTKSLVMRFLDDMGIAGDGTTYAYRNLQLIGLGLSDIGVLSTYQFIKHLNLSSNSLTSLVVLSNMPWLVTLIASNNRIESLLDFTAPRALRHVDLSYNQVRLISDLSEHAYIETLNLDHNEILMIGGLNNCRRLKELRLAHNRISRIEALGQLPIQKLDLSYNQLSKIECLEKLELLMELDLSGNRIRSLSGLGGHNVLTRLDLSSNEIIDIGELELLRPLLLLDRGEFSLNLSKNPLCELPDFRLHVIHMFPNLAVLNNKRVLTEERTSSQYALTPSLEQVAAVNHSMLAVYSFLQPAVLETYTLPDAEMCYPMLVIVGPDGSGREYLMVRLAAEFPDVFSAGPLCTSRQLFSDELDGRDVAHVPLEMFDSQIKAGQFLSIYNQGEHIYGFSKQSLDQAAMQGTACVTHMELEGMLCLRLMPSLRPRYVLTVPLDADAHDARLRGRGVLTDKQVHEAASRCSLHVKYHRRHPGLFDAVIATDNLEEAYAQLKRLVMDYLGRPSASAALVKEATNVSASGDFGPPNPDPAPNEQEANMVKAIMAGSLVQRNDTLMSPSSNTLGTERSLYRVRYEALQRVMSGTKRSAGLKELMGSKKDPRQAKSAGGRSGKVIVALPVGGRCSPGGGSHRSESVTFGIEAGVPADDDDGDQLIRDEGAVSDDEMVAVDMSYRLLGDGDAARPASSNSQGRLGSARYNVLPPISNVDGQTVEAEP